MFWQKKKQEEIEIISKKVNKLIIYFNNKDIFTYTNEMVSPIIEPWKRFYKWYFCRNSHSFIIKHKDGYTMIKRENINSFEVKIIEVK